MSHNPRQLCYSGAMSQPRLTTFQQASAYALAGRFDEMLSTCKNLVEISANNVDELLDIGGLLSNFGYLSLAQECFLKVQVLAPNDLRPLVNLANLARDAGDHAESQRLYAALLKDLPDHPVIRRNALVSLEYDPSIADDVRLGHAKAWGDWAIAQAGGWRQRPPLAVTTDRPLRIGYVSADFCQHTVGLLVKEVLKAHDKTRVEVFAYSAGVLKDWVADELRPACRFREVAAMDDMALACQIRDDAIDVLVDLSGHTAGSRLTAFAHRPAPVMVSWLGYFATTGLKYIDAVLLDQWHAPEGTEAQFIEPIIRLSQRLCYTPVPWMPAVTPSPTFTNEHITFGSFNNSAKYNLRVFSLWAQILAQVSNSRLVLKWRTFNDETFRQSVLRTFAEHGIHFDRIELRGPSFHADLLKQYADIDIALDTLPFCGGLTSCEALYLGIPVVTWPQSRVVSRQTYAFLSAIGAPELVAKDEEGYVRIAVELAGDRERLKALHETLRQRMQAPPFGDVACFTRQLENTLIDLHRKIAAEEKERTMNQKTLLNVGAGHPKSGAKIPVTFQTSEWQEIRLDIDPANEPDVIGTMLDMSAVADASVDAIYSSHTIEHLYPDEIPQAMREFLRVLKPEGYAIITCPDLQAAAQMIAEDKLMEVAYNSPAGPVTPFDIVYSHRMFTGRDKPYMAHHCGFTLKVLSGTLQSNGFASVAGKRRPKSFDLWVLASKNAIDEEILRELASRILPA